MIIYIVLQFDILFFLNKSIIMAHRILNVEKIEQCKRQMTLIENIVIFCKIVKKQCNNGQNLVLKQQKQ